MCMYRQGWPKPSCHPSVAVLAALSPSLTGQSSTLLGPNLKHGQWKETDGRGCHFSCPGPQDLIFFPSLVKDFMITSKFRTQCMSF